MTLAHPCEEPMAWRDENHGDAPAFSEASWKRGLADFPAVARHVYC